MVWKRCNVKINKNTVLTSNTAVCSETEREFQFWSVDFNFDVQVPNSEFIFMARCIVFKLDDIESTIHKRPNKRVEAVWYNFLKLTSRAGNVQQLQWNICELLANPINYSHEKLSIVLNNKSVGGFCNLFTGNLWTEKELNSHWCNFHYKWLIQSWCRQINNTGYTENVFEIHARINAKIQWREMCQVLEQGEQ